MSSAERYRRDFGGAVVRTFFLPDAARRSSAAPIDYLFGQCVGTLGSQPGSKRLPRILTS
jgi:hypothetical protein